MGGMTFLTCSAVRRITEHPYRAARVDDIRELYVVQMGSARGRGPRAQRISVCGGLRGGEGAAKWRPTAERAPRGWECGPGLVRPLR
jgi:hypothetical protein